MTSALAQAQLNLRLQRLAYLEEQVKQGQLLPKHLISKCSCLNSTDVYSMVDGVHCDDCDKLK